MPQVLVTAELPSTSGIGADSAVNNFAFTSDIALDAAERLDIFNAVAAFYASTPAGGVQAVGAYLASSIDRTVSACALKMYDISADLDGSPHGSPIDEATFTLPAAGDLHALPSQTCAVLTLRARDALNFPVEGVADSRPRARRTGRLFIGPLNADAEAASGGVTRPSSPFRDDLCRAAEALQDALVDGDYAWGVWSRALQAVIPVTRAEADDSFDVLRSRKLDPTARTVRTFAPEPALILGA